MKSLAEGLMRVLALGLLAEVARADGKLYIPMESVPPRIPYQRALLVFHDGSETMLVQSKYQFLRSASSDTLGWVVRHGAGDCGPDDYEHFLPSPWESA
jgi:hypothetical protein